jgi:hypothetical protein
LTKALIVEYFPPRAGEGRLFAFEADGDDG